MALKKLNTQFRDILIGIGILGLIILTGISVNYYKNQQILKENTKRVESEMRFKQLEKEAVNLKSQKDSIMEEIAKKQAVIDYLENNPTLIIQNNDKIHLDIDKLNAYNTAVLWTNNIADYESNRERYSLHRFGKTTKK